MQTLATDPNSPSLRDPAYPDTRAVAREFASLFNTMMLRAMRKTVPEGSLIPTSMGEKIYTDLLDSEFAKILATHGTSGLTDMILKQIQNDQEQGAAMRRLQSLGNNSWMTDSRFVPTNRADAFPSLAARVARWEGIIVEAGSRYNVDTDLIRAVVAQESAGDPHAVSRAGAKGLMQLMDTTAQDLGVRSVFNPKDNVNAGTRYLSSLISKFHGDVALALASYNAGPAAVERYNGIPPYPETQNYVQKVLGMRDRFAQGASQ